MLLREKKLGEILDFWEVWVTFAKVTRPSAWVPKSRRTNWSRPWDPKARTVDPEGPQTSSLNIYCKTGLTVSLCFYGISNHKLGFGGNVCGIFTGNGHFQQIYGRGEHFQSEIVDFHPILNFYCHQHHLLLKRIFVDEYTLAKYFFSNLRLN